ncbi:MAG: hypothetical protein AB1921_09635 [Thermodesulfobacteriota bacterium]
MKHRARFRAGFWAALLALALAAPALAGTRVLLPSGFFRAGVPQARGMCRDTASLGLKTGAGMLPVQASPLAVWPDGSVKWLLLQGENPGAACPAELAGGIRWEAPSGPVCRVEENSGGFSVTDGVVSFLVPKRGSALIRNLVSSPGAKPFDITGFLTFISAKSPGDVLPLAAVIPGAGISCEPRIESVTVEEQGFYAATLAVRGAYLARGFPDPAGHGAGQCPFTVRIRVMAGAAMLGIAHTFTYELAPTRDFLGSAGLFLKGFSPGKNALGFAGTTQQNPAGLALFSQGPDKALWWKQGANGPETSLVDLSDSGGLVVVGDKKLGVRLPGLGPDTPTGVSISGAGEVSVLFYPPQARPLDLRRYALAWGTGETGAGGKSLEDLERFAATAAVGVSRTHTAWLCFPRPAGGFSNPPEIVAAFSPETLAQSKVLGSIAPYSAPRGQTILSKISGMLDPLLAGRKDFSWYGFLDNGDVQQWKDRLHANGRYENDFGRWAWANGDGMGRVAEAFLLTGMLARNPAYLAFGMENARHVADVDVVNAKNYAWDYGKPRDVSGCAHRHNVQHYGDPYVGARGGNPGGFRLAFYLTGDGRMKDALDLAADMTLAYVSGDRQRFGHSANGADGLGTGLLAAFTAYERTGDPRFREAFDTLLAQVSFSPEKPWQAFLLTQFSAYAAAAAMYNHTGDPRYQEATRELAPVFASAEMEESWTWPSPGAILVFSDAVGQGMSQYMNPLGRALDAYLADKKKPRGATVNMALSMPYAMQALAGGRP